MLKTTIKTALLGTALAFSLPMAASAQETASTIVPSQTVTIDVKLKGSVFGVSMIKAFYKGQITSDSYAVRADIKTSGLGALLKKLKIWATTSGTIEGAYQNQDLRPKAHIQQNMDKKNRRVEMLYGQSRVDVNIVPRLGSQGTPPASPLQRFQSDDAVTAILNIMLRGYKTGDKPCSGDVPVFDSKQHYILRLKRNGTRRIKQKGYKGDTIRCMVYYIPVSGFDPEDLPSEEEGSTPITMYLANFEDAGLYIPVRMTYKISGFKAVIKARDIKINIE